MPLLERIAAVILPVFAVIAIGYGYARMRGGPAKNEVASINRLTMEILCPILIFTALAARDFDLEHNGILIFAGILISLGSGVLAWPVARLMGYDARTFVPPMMFNNCGNMGLPLAVFAFGSSGLSPAVALFMAGNLVYFSFGLRILESGRGHGTAAARWRFLYSPIMISMVIGLAFAAFKIVVPPILMSALKMLGESCIPLMLFSLGVRMMDTSLKSWRIGLVGAIACPAAGLAVAAVLAWLLPLTPIQSAQMFLFASLPPAVFCFVVAEQYGQEP
ncbi:MAG: malonate transporter, partial [Paucimonas sp.]|nr:malonate transporter [Paucimonas sp.]